MAQKFFPNRERLVDQLLRDDFEFRQLFREHQSLEEQLAEMGRKKYLTQEEEVERKYLQKTKLQGKDRMEEILRDHSGRENKAISL